MSSPNGENPVILYDLMKIADLHFLMKPLRIGKCKRVNFNDIVDVFYIVSRSEIIESNLKPVLWWDTSEFESFKFDALKDIKQFIDKHPDVDFNSARKIIYNLDLFNNNH